MIIKNKVKGIKIKINEYFILKLKQIIEPLLVIDFFVSINLLSISNYKISGYVIKTIVILQLLIIIWTSNLINRNSFAKSLEFLSIKKYGRHLIIILLVIFISALFSRNAIFGIEKLLNLIFFNLSVIIIAKYLFESINEKRIQAFVYHFIIICCILSITVIISSPFSYKSGYNIFQYNWSHVIFGKLLSIPLLISFYLFLESKTRNKKIYFSITTLILFNGIFFTGFRSSLLGLIICVPILLVLNFKKYNFSKIFIFAIIIILTISFYKNFSINPSLFQKYKNFMQLNIDSDGTLNARISLYKLAVEQIKLNPIIGLGFGGFKSYLGTDLSLNQKYPHNIFLEFGVEFGVVGLIIFLFLLKLLLSKAFQISPYVFIFYLYYLIIACFSKDIPNQQILFSGFIFLFLEKKTFERLTEIIKEQI